MPLNKLSNFIRNAEGKILYVNPNDIDATTLYRKLYDNMYDILQPQSIPQTVIILADYQYKHAFVADAEINTVACLTELMVEFK